ncbi:hypothetical protein EV360DRAFT_90696 [Lentinula raphanica]|nr:hypothetical protein EV360DRAFT_90696 [Lentinula raphanica]
MRPLQALENRFNGGKVTLIFPLNVNSSHWSVGAICGSSSTIAFYDSLEGFSRQATYQAAYQNMKKLWNVIAGVWSEDSSVRNKEWAFNIVSKIPQQANGSDCGVFASMYMLHLGYGPDINHQHVPTSYRLPARSQNMAGWRLCLFEELELC